MQRYKHGGDIYVDPGIRLDFSVNVNPRGLPEQVKTALTGQMDSFTRYPDPHCRALCAALAAHHSLSAENILCGNGAADLIFRICAWKKPEKVLVPAPTFSEYERSVRTFGGEMVEFPLREEDGFALTEDFLAALTEDIDAVFLCNPNNPTGRLVPAGLLEQIARRCTELEILMVVDECFLEFTGGQSLIPLLPDHPNLLILRAFTKLYAMAGLRLGYLLGDAEMLSEIAAYGAAWSVSAPAQTGGIAALSAEPVWTAETRKQTVAERAFLTEQLLAFGITVFPSDANFLLLKTERPLYAALKTRGILTRDCSNFSGLDERFIRVGLKTRENDRILLDEIKEALYG